MKNIFIIITFLLVSVLIIFILNGGGFKGLGFNLDVGNEVMIVLLSTTTINVIGLGLIVLRGHFHEKEKLRSSVNKKKNLDKST